MAKEVTSYNTRVFTNLAIGVRSKVITALGTLVGTSQSYYTAADVAEHLCRNIHGRDPEDYTRFVASVNQVLFKSFDKKLDNVKRTSGRIAAKIAVNTKASYGYRIGMALGTIVNEDTVRESQNNTACYEKLLEHKLPTAKLLVEELNFAQLAELQQAVITRMALLHDTLETSSAIFKHLSKE